MRSSTSFQRISTRSTVFPGTIISIPAADATAAIKAINSKSSNRTRERSSISRQPKRNRKYKEPPQGDALLIDPRKDNPLDFICLNLSTLKYAIAAAPETEAFSRGKWTIDCLGLNDREVLVRSRKEAYGNYLARLEAYRAKRNTAPAEKLKRMEKNIKNMAHPTALA